MTAVKVAKLVSRPDLNARGRRNQALVYRVMDAARSSGTPKTHAEISAETGLAERAITRHARTYLSQVTTELLDWEVLDDGAYHAWTTLYRSFQAWIANTPDGPALDQRFVQLTIETLDRAGQPVTATAVSKFVKGRWPRIMAAVKAWKTTAKSVSVPDINARARGNRALVHQALDTVRASGTPMMHDELVAKTGLSGTTVTRHAHAYLKQVNAELLGWAVSDDAALQAWMGLYRSFQTRILTSPESRALQDRLRQLIIENLDRAGQPVTFGAVAEIAKGDWHRTVAAVKEWERRTGRPPAQYWPQSPLVPLGTVLSLVDPALRCLPLTFLDDSQVHRPLTATSLRMIAGLKQPKLRNTAFFCLATADTTSRSDSQFFGAFAGYLTALGLADVDELDPDAFYRNFHDGRLLPSVARPARVRWLKSYFRLLGKQDDYLQRLTSEQAHAVAPFRLHSVTNASFWRRSPLQGQVKEESQGRRKAATAAIHGKFYLFRNIAERRLNQLVRLRQAFQDACARARSDGPSTSFPFPFAYSEEAVTASGSVREVTHRFQLWNGHAVRDAHAAVAPKRFYEPREILRSFELNGDALFLSYEGASTAAETVVEAEFWFVDLVRAGGLTTSTEPAFRAAHGYGLLAFFPPARPDWDRHTGTWLKRVGADLNSVFLPVDTLLASGLAGHAALQIMTKTGARMGEFLQIRLTREHLTRVDLPNGKEVIAFHAKPKGRDAEEPFYIDGRCLKALHAWFAFLREHGGGAEVVEASHQIRAKCKPAPYLFQFKGRHFSHNDVNACLRLMLHGIEVATADGGIVSLSAHLFRHGFATEMRELEVPLDVIALLMKQRDVDVTRFYSQPTPAQLVEVQERIFIDRLDLTRTHLRAPAAIRRQLEDARGGVGALVPVVGGTCTVANMCPAKFACIGCAGNAPDPAKRAQVEERKVIYESTIRRASEQGLPAEERTARKVVGDCEDMLAEMDLIEATERDGAQVAELRYDEAVRHPGGRGRR